MELKLDKTSKILLGAIALGLFLNASDVFIDKAYANDYVTKKNLKIELTKAVNALAKENKRLQVQVLECMVFKPACSAHMEIQPGWII